MRRLSASVRVRVTLAATLVVALLLTVASVAIIRLVEDDLVREAEAVVADAVEDLAGELEELALPEGALVPIEVEGVDLFAGIAREDDVVISELFDSETREWAGEIVIDPEEGEIVDAFLDDEDIPFDEVPDDLIELAATVVRLDDDRLVVAAAPLDDVRDSIDSLRDSLLLVIPLVALVLAAVVWVLVGIALRPVRRMSAQAERISAHTLAERVPEPGSNDEIGELAVVINRMLDRIERGVHRERRFVSHASHELRTPLATIRAASEVALQRGADEPDGGWPAVAADVRDEVDRMDALVSDLLVLARLDEAAGVVTSEPVDVDEIVRAAIEAEPGSGAVEVDRRTSPGLLVRGDRRMLEVMLANLVRNARRHAATRVIVGAGASGDRVVITVDDDGPGIPSADRERIFERFEQLDPARTGTGTGLGLAIVKTVVEAHDGTVTVADADPVGASFRVSLPAA